MHPNDGRVVSNFIIQALQNLPITIYGDGSQSRSFCYVDDLIEVFVRLMDSPDDVTGPVNTGNPVEFTILELAEKEKNEHREKLLRVAAEFENFKKRMIREKQELARYSNEKLISDMLSALDDLDRVLDHISPDSSNDVKKIAEGVELVKKSLLSTLKKYNLNEIEALKQKFDPSIHEAIAIVESGASKPGTVISVHRKGYRLHDRLLRPAMVTVAKED